MNLISNHNLYPEIIARLENKSRQVRWSYIIRPKLHPGETLAERPHLAKRGNVAACELVLENGEQFEEVATSKKKPINMPGTKNGPDQIFVPREDRAKRDHEGYYKLNTTDPEYKILNILASQLLTHCEKMEIQLASLSGTLYLYTERFICSGCEESIRDFEQMFPKINIFVFWGDEYP
jgi:hypothetical protein